MAYITKSNEGRITEAIIRLDIFQDLDLNIYKYPILALSIKEKERLAKIKDFFENFELYIEEVFKVWKKEDTKTFVKELIPPRYHGYIDCEGLNSDFWGYLIPIEIKSRGDEMINKYRQWFLENEHLITEDLDLFNKRLQLRFPFIQNTEALKRQHKENTGRTSFEDMSLAQLETKIDLLVQEIESFRNTSNATKKSIERFGDSTHLIDKIDFENTNEKGILEKWHQYKLDLKKLLETFYKAKFSDSDLEYDSKLLESLGFQECYFCKRRKLLEKSINKFGF